MAQGGGATTKCVSGCQVWGAYPITPPRHTVEVAMNKVDAHALDLIQRAAVRCSDI
jgi:pyruvate/2-oxoacid:ferredoxin oxidoreductase alpha subunit